MPDTTLSEATTPTRSKPPAAQSAGPHGDTDIRLLVGFHQHTPADPLEIAAEVISVRTTPGGGDEVRNLNSWGYDAHPFAELQVRAVAYRDEPAGDSHGWTVVYRNCLSVDLERACAMQQTLRKVEQALARRRVELGPPETFTAYLARAAVALQVTKFGFRVGERTGWHDQNEYQWTDAEGMVHRISDHLARWRAKPAGS